MKRYYAIRVGRQCGVVVNCWDECQKLVDGFSGASYKGFDNEDRAIDFATTPVVNRINVQEKIKYRPNETLNQRFNRLNPCVERRTYKDPFTGELYVNRCVRRKAPAPVRGSDYQPTDDRSVPWN
jgi:hypothetical protein